MPSGSSDPAALRALKLTLIFSSLALLMGADGHAGLGPLWFGRDAPVEPRSPHVWPDDSTTYVPRQAPSFRCLFVCFPH